MKYYENEANPIIQPLELLLLSGSESCTAVGRTGLPMMRLNTYKH